MRHHVEDALLTPGRDPAHVVPDGAERALAQAVLVERDEPLLGRAEQRRVLAAQQCGLLWAGGCSATNAPRVLRCAMIFGLASHTVRPAKCSTSDTNRPSSSTGL